MLQSAYDDRTRKLMGWVRKCDLCSAEMPIGKTPVTGHSNMPVPPGQYSVKLNGKTVEVVVMARVSGSHIDVCKECVGKLVTNVLESELKHGYGVM